MPQENVEATTNVIDLTAEIVSAYVANNPVPIADLAKLIADTHTALIGLTVSVEPITKEALTPAVPVRKSVTPDYIICLEDGKKFKSLKRHLSTHYNLTPDQYREKWNLQPSYPMVAPNYSASRSALAKRAGLGRKPAPEPAQPAKRPRKKLGLNFKRSGDTAAGGSR